MKSLYRKHKSFIDGAGWCFTLFTVIAFIMFVKVEAMEHSYSEADRTAMNELIAKQYNVADYDSIPRISMEDLND